MARDKVASSRNPVGRPAKPMPSPIPDTPENVARAVLFTAHVKRGIGTTRNDKNHQIIADHKKLKSTIQILEEQGEGEMEILLDEEKRFLETNRENLKEQYGNDFLVIQGNQVHGHYKNLKDATSSGMHLFGKGPFLVKSAFEQDIVHCIPVLAFDIPVQGKHDS